MKGVERERERRRRKKKIQYNVYQTDNSSQRKEYRRSRRWRPSIQREDNSNRQDHPVFQLPLHFLLPCSITKRVYPERIPLLS